MIYSELTGNCKKYRIKSLYDNIIAYVEWGHRVKIHGKFTGRVVEGAHMLRDAIDESKDNFQADAGKILARLFGK